MSLHALTILDQKNGSQVQDLRLHTSDESQISERERLIMILTAIAYEVEHNMLTEELSDELYFYHEDMLNGDLYDIRAENEVQEVKNDIKKYHDIVF